MESCTYSVVRVACCNVCALIEQDVCHHRREEEGQTTSETLDASEATARRSVEDGEPDVAVSHVLLRLRPEQVLETRQFFFPDDWYHSINLLKQRCY